MEKIKFIINDIEDGWPPVKYENLWGEKNGKSFKIKNAPFFLNNLAFEDVVEIKELEENLYDIERVITPSRFSTIWLYINEDEDISIVLKKIKDLKCGVEGGVVDNYYSINIPSKSILDKLDKLLNTYVSQDKIMVDYPCIKVP